MSRDKIISRIYESLKAEMDTSGVPEVSMSHLPSVYTDTPIRIISFICVGGLLIHLFFNLGAVGIMLPFITIGLLRRKNVDETKWVLIGRVSSESQLGNTSTQTQLRDLNNEVDRMEGKVMKTFEGAESARTMNRESANKILTMAENEQFGILGVWKLDRLTRADPWESIDYLHRIKEEGIILYSGAYGYFDWGDLNDVRRIFDQVVFSREWYKRIEKNAEEGQISKLKQGKWPFGHPHFGYSVDENKNISLTSQGKQIIPKIFEIYIETENRAETRRRINNSGMLKGAQLSDTQMEKILTSGLCVGHLELKGEVIRKSQELEAVGKETYRIAQDILRQRRPSTTTVENVPDPINQAAHKFGPEFIVNIVDTLTIQCPKCESDLSLNGTATRWGRKVKNYQCEECNWQGPLLGEHDFREIHSVHILTCPYCTATEEFAAKRIQDMTDKYAYFCLQCENRFDSNHPPDKYERAFENPDLAFRFDGEDIVNSKNVVNNTTDIVSNDAIESEESVNASESSQENLDAQTDVIEAKDDISEFVFDKKSSENAGSDPEMASENEGGRPRKLDQNLLPELEKCLHEGPKANGLEVDSWTRSQIVKVIEKEFGISVSVTTAGRYISDLDWDPPW